MVRLSGFCLLLAVSTLLCGCATSGRRVLLKEYSPTVLRKANSPLTGAMVSIKPFGEMFNIKDLLPDKSTFEPPGYTYLKMTPEQVQMWDRDVVAQKKSSSESNWKEIGNVRNGFGMVLSKVYAVNPPGQWLADTLKMDLREQGASIVEGPEASNATVSIEGSIRYFKVDIYMKYWADLIVDVRLKVKDKPTIERTIHTTGGQAAWSSSSFEYYQPIRQCQQKLSRALIDEIEKSLKN